jgi:rhamnose utilization protein RhaD (predicted bifunctional aldolase and dehydrogenase)
MESRFVEAEAQDLVARYAGRGIPADLALRIYTTRLLGQNPKLVLHGGGNTSVKLRLSDLMGDETEVLCVKGSGWDMGQIEPPGLPAVRLVPLRRLRTRDALSDEEMVAIQRANLIEPNAPTPSIETLLHAFLPHKFVDHTHATAVLSLIDQPDGEAISAEVYDGQMGIVPYIMPGFALAKKAADVFEAMSDARGLILHKHGIFTFGETAREAYERMIDMVSRAETRLRRGRTSVFVTSQLPQQLSSVDRVAPIVRGACSLPDANNNGANWRLILDFRSGPTVLNYVNGAELARYSQAGVVTPDHTIRTKNWPLVVPAPEDGREDQFKQTVRTAVAAFVTRYRAYFDSNNARCQGSKRMLDPLPRVAAKPPPRSPPILPKLPSRRLPMPRRLAGSSRSPKPICSMSSTGHSSKPSSANRRKNRWPGRSRSSPVPPARSEARRRAPLRRPAPRSRCSTSMKRRRDAKHAISAEPRWPRVAT